MKEYARARICEIGCGETKQFNNSIGIDMRITGKTDVIADARKLPFKDESFDYIYSSHIIEHFSHEEVESVLIEWIRCLKEEGGFELRCPDLRARALIFFLRPSWDNIKNIYGEQNYKGNYHSCGFAYNLIKEKLELNGITNVKRILDGYKCIPFIPCDLHIKGIKHRDFHTGAEE